MVMEATIQEQVLLPMVVLRLVSRLLQELAEVVVAVKAKEDLA
jgi:hypothetical protein